MTYEGRLQAIKKQRCYAPGEVNRTCNSRTYRNEARYRADITAILLVTRV